MLAIGAMANPDSVGIDLGFVCDVTAMASAFYVHGYPPGGEKNETAYHLTYESVSIAPCIGSFCYALMMISACVESDVSTS
jgi:hypothetical protein